MTAATAEEMIPTPRDDHTPSFAAKVAGGLSTLAFPIVWYGCSALTIWASFTRALAASSPTDQIYVWRRHGSALGDFIFFAVGLWMLHVATVIARRARWRTIPGEFRGLASGVAGGLVFAVGRTMFALLPSGSFWIAVSIIVAAIVMTEVAMRLFARRA